MDYRSPISRARGLGSAKEGAAHWWMQRLTAAALVPLLLWFVASLIGLTGAGYDDAVAWVSTPWITVLLIATIAVVFHHAQLGLQVVLEDYVHSEWLKVLSIALVKFAAVLLAIGGIYSVLRVAFGG